MAGLHPSKPRFTFRVGVVGHRWDKLGLDRGQRVRPAEHASPAALEPTADVEARLTAAVRSVLAAIAGRLIPIAGDPTNGYAPEGKPRLAVVSGLAEGADRIVAHAGASEGFELWAVLPFDAAAYSKDFDGQWQKPAWSRPGSAAEFDRLLAGATETMTMDGVPGRYDAYEALGRAVLNHSDILIAIWDGDTARGPGGTANLLIDARRDEVPIVRIDPADPSRIWLEDLTDQETEGRAGGLAGLAVRLDQLVKPPELAGLAGPEEWNGRLAFFREERMAGRLGKAYRAMKRRFLGFHGPIAQALTPTAPSWLGIGLALFDRSLPRNFEERSREVWAARWGPALADSAGLDGRVLGRLAPIHGWLDQLAGYYAERHRSAYTTVFSLAWMAAVAAVAALIGHVFHWPIAGLLSAIELGVILAILAITVWGRSGKFHERWIDYRALEQRVRHLGFLWPLGAATTVLRMSARPSADDPRVGWTGWLYRALVRQLGFGAARFDAGHLRACERLLRELEIPDQRSYHDRAAAEFRHLHHAVHLRTEWLFLAAGIVASLHLLGAPHWLAELLPGGGASEKRELVIGSVLTLFSVFLPARAAALHGWAGHADFHGAALRSAEIELRLEELERVIDTLVVRNSTTLGEAAVAAARAMETELGAWRATSLSRPLQRV